MKKNSFFIIVIFLASIILPLVFSDKAGGKISKTENRYLAPFPTILTPEMRLAHGVRSGLESWINDNVGFRTYIKKLQADIDFHFFHISPSSLVHIGKSGWYFYTGDNDLEIARGTYSLTPDLLEKIKANQERIQNALKKKGIEYIIVLIPSKTSVYPEYIGGGDYVVRDTVIDIATDYLRKNTTIPVINTKPDLLRAKKTETVYFKTDTHWNDAGAYIGYRSIITTLNELGMIHSSPISTSTVPSTRKGEFSAIMGNEDLLAPEPYDAIQIVSPKAVKIDSGDYYNNIQALIKLDNVDFGLISYDNPTAEQKRLLIYGDSFFALGKITDLLAENFSKVDFIRSDQIRDNIVEQVKPDMVILERTERYIYSLANLPDPTLLSEPLTNPQAEIVSDTTPSQVVRGSKVEIDVIVKNSGTETWNEDKQIRLAIFQDGSDQYRVGLPDSVEVKPGETYTFKFEDFQAPPGKTTYLEYQMVDEGYKYFGEKKRVDIAIK